MYTNYQYYFDDNNNVYAVSTYAGKTVKGIAKCHPNDIFDEKYGKALAAARCNYKVSLKRKARAEKKLEEARIALEQAVAFYNKMEEYYSESELAARVAFNDMIEIEEEEF